MTSIHAQPVFDAATAREKAQQAEQLAAEIAAFQRGGGKVQILGNTPIDTTSISRRQVVEGGADRRKAKKGANE
ncbi:hypothetical protein [Stenotrophomonas sp. VV52]|uniref:hypothetical protein n=1 Tax=Stenotrophomonas sp. VV52 TaxID=2066958 RepID=UPI000C9E2222|nr:hypothetical protein [Stenotrophomonas sp. VV52]